MNMDKFLLENTLYGWPPRVNLSDLSPEERASVLEQKEKLEKEKEEIKVQMFDYIPNNKLLDIDIPKDLTDYISKAINDLITNMIKSRFPKTEELNDIEYEEFIQALADAYKEEKTLDYLSGGNSNEYREIE